MSIITLSFQSFKVQLIVATTHKALSILGKQAH